MCWCTRMQVQRYRTSNAETRSKSRRNNVCFLPRTAAIITIMKGVATSSPARPGGSCTTHSPWVTLDAVLFRPVPGGVAVSTEGAVGLHRRAPRAEPTSGTDVTRYAIGRSLEMWIRLSPLLAVILKLTHVLLFKVFKTYTLIDIESSRYARMPGRFNLQIMARALIIHIHISA